MTTENTPAPFGTAIVGTGARTQNSNGSDRNGGATRTLWKDKGPGFAKTISVAEFAFQKEKSDDPKVFMAVSNLGHDELMKARRHALGKRPPLSNRQRRDLADARYAKRQEKDVSGVLSEQERLQTILAGAGNDPALRKRLLDAYHAENGAPAPAVSPLAAARARVTLNDLDWFFSKLAETKAALEAGEMSAEAGNEHRMDLIREFDIDTVSSREMLEIATAGLVQKRRLLTPQEREALLNRIPAEDAPADEDAAPVGPPQAQVQVPAKV